MSAMPAAQGALVPAFAALALAYVDPLRQLASSRWLLVMADMLKYLPHTHFSPFHWPPGVLCMSDGARWQQELPQFRNSVCYAGAFAQVTVAICDSSSVFHRLYSASYCAHTSLSRSVISATVPTVLLLTWQNLIMPNAVRRRVSICPSTLPGLRTTVEMVTQGSAPHDCCAGKGEHGPDVVTSQKSQLHVRRSVMQCSESLPGSWNAHL